MKLLGGAGKRLQLTTTTISPVAVTLLSTCSNTEPVPLSQISSKENKENSPPAAPENQPSHGAEATKKAQPFTPCCPLNLDAENSPKETRLHSLVSADRPDSLPESERDLAMAKRVRRSYSRLDVSLSHSFTEKQGFPSFGLAGTSTPVGGPGKRQTLFGFEKLLLPAEPLEPSALHPSGAPKTAAVESGAIGNLDTDIPGISFGREKRRKKKMPQFDVSWGSRAAAVDFRAGGPRFNDSSLRTIFPPHTTTIAASPGSRALHLDAWQLTRVYDGLRRPRFT